jgi:myo-inositol-1(or 4)-monophosphatase
MTLNPAELLPSVIDIAQQAGAIIMRHYAAPITASTKANRIDMVTIADKESEIYIVAALKALYPTHHIVGEEGGSQGVALAEAEYLWFVDPVDGTTNFASKLPQFCTSIALTDKNRQPLLAVIYDPAKRELFTATKGGGAWMNGRPVRVTETTELIDSVMASGFPTDRVTNADNNLREWAAIVPLIRGERRLGSAALDLAYVAAGRLDGFWESGLNPWDATAGVLLVEEAGGCVTDYDGEPMPQRQDRGRYVATNGKIHTAFLEALQSVRNGNKAGN